MKQFIPQNGTYFYFRYDDKNLVMVAVNNSQEPKTVDLERFNEMSIIGAKAVEVTTNEVYNLEKSLTIPPKTVLVLKVE
ncbi:hypothetical protein FACS189429_2540 [Bacteroidia bacterium]|nr:hypothetical protein FACS189429_2540 [Bacteroidia bacterium]